MQPPGKALPLCRRLLTIALLILASTSLEADDSLVSTPGPGIIERALATKPEPDVRTPGPDSPDFPDSPFAVPPGVAYLETSLTIEKSQSSSSREYSTATLVRVGLVKNFELRVSSPGFIAHEGPPDDKSGFGPITLGAKWHLWDEMAAIPPAGLIVQVTTRTGSRAFRPSGWQPATFIAFDHSLPWEVEFEWNAGIMLDENGTSAWQGVFLWSISKEVGEDVRVFVHGFVSRSENGSTTETMIGPGLLYFAGQRLALDASYTLGLTAASPEYILRFGVSFAF